MITFHVNNTVHSVDVRPDTPLLWVLRDHLKLTGTKFGCGEGVCGACTVLIDEIPHRSCSTQLSVVQGKKVTTIEGLPADNPVKRAWLEQEVSQCGYCQPGQILSAAALLQKNPKPTDHDIDNSMSDNICRCGTYNRIRKAIHMAAAAQVAEGGTKS